MDERLKEALITSACKSMYGVNPDELSIKLTKKEEDDICELYVSTLKEAGFQVKGIVKFKEGDIIGTDCGNYADKLVMSVKDDILETSIYHTCGHKKLFEIVTYDKLIERGFRIKDKE